MLNSYVYGISVNKRLIEGSGNETMLYELLVYINDIEYRPDVTMYVLICHLNKLLFSTKAIFTIL